MDAEIDEPAFKHLKDYDDKELYWFLKNNEKTTMLKLSGICSEVLRRQLMPLFLEEPSVSSD